ncbi:helix-turn-helix domain-containing protein [Streptomyces cavourensis]
MGLAERRRALGYSQEKLAQLLGVDRTTVGRWENGRVHPQPPQRRGLADALEVSLEELNALLGLRRDAVREPVGHQPSEPPNAGDPDDMIRRAFLRMLTVSGALTALPAAEAEALTEGVRSGVPADFARMNSHLWQVYQLSRCKGAVYPVVRDQLATLNEALAVHRGSVEPLLHAAADLFQLAGEVAFDAGRYSDAAASYALAASVGRDARAYDLWACALVRHAYVDMSEHRHHQAAQMLRAAERLAARGDESLSTCQWVASVQAEVYADLGDLDACERAMDRAETVLDLGANSVNGGWLRFDGARLAEERGSRYEPAFQFPPPYLESQRRASSAASRSSSRSARPTRWPPLWCADSSAGVTSQRVTGVVKADTAKPDAPVVRKLRRFTELQNEVATPTASAGSRGKSNPTFASGVSASFLATKISFINAMAEVCETAGADVRELAEIVGHDVRRPIGRRRGCPPVAASHGVAAVQQSGPRVPCRAGGGGQGHRRSRGT